MHPGITPPAKLRTSRSTLDKYSEHGNDELKNGFIKMTWAVPLVAVRDFVVWNGM